MDGHEPQMGKRDLQDFIGFWRSIKPVEESRHLAGKSWRGNGLKVDTLAADRPGDHLHRPVTVVAPCANGDLAHAGSASWEQRGMPGKQSLIGQSLIVMTGRIEHHFDNAFDVAVCGG